jgi:hypothetical protein
VQLKRAIQPVAVAGLLGLGFLGASSTPALADHVRTQCDRDGDYCWRVWCDRDWDDCHPVPGSGYNRYSYYRRPTFYSNYGSNYGSYDGSYYHERRVVCDWDGDDCRPAYTHHDNDDEN